ncbi:MAG: RIP metalloprotease RseP, partial [Phycisphaerae bacterium]
MLHSLTMDSILILGDSPAWVSSAWSILQVIIGFSLIVFVHEMGHFLAAKWAGVRVERFAVGFGRELFGFTRGETRYSFNILPLGGYVKMLGQEDFVVDKTGELKVKNDPDSFTNKPVGKRMVIVTAGVVMNLVFAAIAFTIVVMVGRLQPPPIIGYVRENSPAGRAGLRPGDRIEEINGDKITSFYQLSGRIALSDSDETLDMRVWRDGQVLEPHPRIVPEFVKEEQIRQIGVGPASQQRVWFPSFQGANPTAADQLEQFDDIHQIKIDGGFRVVEDLGTVLRAMMRAQGEPIEAIVKRPKDPDALTDEQLQMYDAEIPSTDVQVNLRAIWMPSAYEVENRVSASMLGLVPRITVLQPAEGKSFDAAGVRTGDVIVQIGDVDFPSYHELKEQIEDETRESVAIKVRRPWEANRGLSETVVSLCSENREEIIAAAFQDLPKALAVVYRLAIQFELSDSDQEILIERLRKLDDASAWRTWFEQVDVHTLASIKPK